MNLELKQKWIRQAISLAEKNIEQGQGGPFGAIVVINNQVVAEGANHVTRDLDPTAHAEVVAIRRACAKLGRFDLRGAELYSSCEPCPMCLAAIYWARIDRVFFASTRKDAAQIDFDDDFLYQEIPKALEDRTLPMENVLRDEGLIVFSKWARMDNKIKY